MFFTLYYAYATIMQWWRIKTLRNKLNGTLNRQNALIVTTGYSFRTNRKQRCLENLLFRQDDRIGCTVVPKQKINLAHWISFPKNLRYFPIYIEEKFPKICTSSSNAVFVHIQAILDKYVKHQSEIIQVEHFGELIGWRVGDGFEIILKTDIDHLTKLIFKFSRNNLDINHELQLMKIETVDIEGAPTNIKYEKKFLRDATVRYSYAPVHWNKFVSEIKELYAKIRDVTNPKIKIENGATNTIESFEVPPKIVTKKETLKKQDAVEKSDKNTLEVAGSDHRRHKHAEKSGQKTKNKEATTATITNKSKIKSQTHHIPGKSTTEDKSEINKHQKKEVKKSSSSKIKEKDIVKVTEDVTNKCTNIENNSSSKSETNINNGKDDDNLSSTKPPNVLVYADSIITKDNVKRILYSILNMQTYTIYDLPVTSKPFWNSSTILVVVCGTVPPEITTHLIQYYLKGGQLLCLCSDLMYSILHTFTTAEVREHELVRFSYGNWERVKMMHHIFCYQASPAKKQFSKDSDQSSNHSSNGSSPLAPRTPSLVDLKFNDKDYHVQVQVLGTEETWQTPSILLAKVKNSKGRAIFSQVHLEIDPDEYENDETKYDSLKSSNEARLDILRDILTKHLDMICDENQQKIDYSVGYFLGRYELKLEILSQCENIINNQLTCDKINVVFCGNNVDPGISSNIRLPVMIHSCPSNFSTRDYFEILATEYIGRLVIYTDIITSSQNLLDKKLRHGLVVIPRQQTNGIGRSNNTWLTPIGSAAFSVQLHISMSSHLGQLLPLVQHLIPTAIVTAIRSLPGYQDLNIGIKWPNDIYADGNIKIGGLIVKSTIVGSEAIINVGVGFNLCNQQPTICLNDLIERYNRVKCANLQPIAYEKYFAIVFNEIEKLFNQVQSSGVDCLFDLYYKYWLHGDSEVTIETEAGIQKQAKIIGLDKYGYLSVRMEDGKLQSVQPDGNSFDMIRGLIIPKHF